MNKKYCLLILFVVAIILIICISKVDNEEDNTQLLDETDTTMTIAEDERTGEYVLYNEKNEVIMRSQEESELQAYVDDPDYNPDPTRTLTENIDVE